MRRIFLLLAIAYPTLLSPAVAQRAPSRWQARASFGANVYSGRPNEEGVGLLSRVDIARPGGAWRLEASFAAPRVIGQTCTLGVPGACSPERPPSPIVTLSLVGVYPRASALYALAGLTVSSRPETARHALWIDPGLEPGLGLRLGRLLSLEARYGYIGFGSRHADAVSLVVRVLVKS